MDRTTHRMVDVCFGFFPSLVQWKYLPINSLTGRQTKQRKRAREFEACAYKISRSNNENKETKGKNFPFTCSTIDHRVNEWKFSSSGIAFTWTLKCNDLASRCKTLKISHYWLGKEQWRRTIKCVWNKKKEAVFLPIFHVHTDSTFSAVPYKRLFGLVLLFSKEKKENDDKDQSNKHAKEKSREKNQTNKTRSFEGEIGERTCYRIIL